MPFALSPCLLRPNHGEAVFREDGGGGGGLAGCEVDTGGEGDGRVRAGEVEHEGIVAAVLRAAAGDHALGQAGNDRGHARAGEQGFIEVVQEARLGAAGDVPDIAVLRQTGRAGHVVALVFSLHGRGFGVEQVGEEAAGIRAGKAERVSGLHDHFVRLTVVQRVGFLRPHARQRTQRAGRAA